MEKDVLISDDAVVLGLLVSCLGLIFYTSQLKSLKTFYKIIPALLLCYLIPSLFSTAGIISPKVSGLWPVAKNYFLPASLILMTLSTDLKGVIKLGPKALIMFFTATIGIIIGGPIAILITSLFSPETVGGLEFDAINQNLPGQKKLSGPSPKIMADIYIDDLAINIKDWKQILQ